MSIGHCGGFNVKTVCPVIFQEYEVDRSSGVVQGNLRNCLELLTEIRVADCAY